MSIIVNGERVFVSLPRKVSPKEFKKQTSSRNSNETKQFLSLYEAKVNNAITEIVMRCGTVTAQNVKDHMLGKVCYSHTLKGLIESHLDILAERTKAEISLMCYQRYKSTYEHLLGFIGDKDIKDITVGDMVAYKTNVLSNHQSSTAYGYMARCKTLFKHAVDNGWLQSNPLATIKTPKAHKKIEIPTMEEYKRIVDKRFDLKRIENAREIFVLAASTGLSYSDLMLLEPSDIKKDGNGNTYIEKHRKKTNVLFTSVVLEEGVEILDKYNNDITPLKKSDQKLNAYLLELQDICGIKCRITMHIGRHLYCSRLIQSGVSPAIVQRAMGHSKVDTTLSFYTHMTTESIIKNIKEVV